MTMHSGVLTSQQSEKDAQLRNMTWQQAGCNVFFTMFGASQVAFAVSQMGWFWGAIIFFLLCLCAWWSGHVLVDCCIETNSYTWNDLATNAFGRSGGLCVAVLQTLGLILTGIVQTEGAGGQWGQSFPNAGICQWWWIIINAIPLVVFSQIPSFGGNWMMVFATGITFVSCIWQQIIFILFMGMYGSYPYTCYGGQTPTTIITATCNMVFSFAVKSTLPEMMREMKNPQEMHKAWAWSQAIALPLYAFYGFVGFYLYGVFSQNAGMQLQFYANPALIAWTTFNLFGALLPCVYGQICLFLKVELASGVLPTDWWKVSNPDENRFSKIPPVLFRLVFRTGVIAAYVVAAEGLVNIGVGFLMSFVGAVAMTGFSFYLPWFVYWRIFSNRISVGMKIVCAFWGFLGIALAIAGAISTVQEMIHLPGGFFVFDAKVNCAQNAFFVGYYSGGNTPESLRDQGAFSVDQGPGSFYEMYYLPVCTEDNFKCTQLEGPLPPNGTCGN